MNSLLDQRTPPHNIEAEQAVIGAIFLDPNTFSIASEWLVPNDFYITSHQMIFEVMYNLFEKGEPIELVTVTSALTSTGSLDHVGGLSYLMNIDGRFQITQK